MKIKLLNNEAVIPTRGSQESAGWDLYSTESAGIPPHSTVMLGTGIAAEIPTGMFGGIFARSGIAAKRGLRPANCVGVVDSDYRGEIKVALHNDTEILQSVEKGERIAQLILIPYAQESLEVCEELSTTERGGGGFGSTGKLNMQESL